MLPVKRNKTSKKVYLGLGSNLSDKLKNMQTGLNELCRLKGFDLEDVSPLYETEPVEYEEQPYFYNAVICGYWDGSPEGLLYRCKSVEKNTGRKTTFKYGPRILDIDILLFDNDIIMLPGLSIPHPKLPERIFVLKPLLDIAPDISHPVNGSIKSIFNNLKDSSKIKLINKKWFLRKNE